ncbi:TolC family protein [Neiella marina]|uniref:TolC family protein n=1 Tax=Neiella holothuriorum TaxID=2870530 RepID=A0ABS7EF09_9GAMM|nr:TolC family protein [Neiella holothuriorum]MBW8190937.1 TolC family protein [Neiella holothuriorum]
MMNPNRNLRLCALVVASFLPLAHTSGVWAEETKLSLAKAVNLALSGDIWQEGNKLNGQAFLSEATAASSLPDPRINISAANIPTDTFNFDQEGMTQLKVGVSQMFPRGDTLQLRREQGKEKNELTLIAAKVRSAKVTSLVSQIYLDAWLAQHIADLIENNRYLFEQLVDVTEKGYTSAAGNTRQQDLIRADLELARLDERVLRIRQQFDTSLQLLLEWLPPEAIANALTIDAPEIEPLAVFKAGELSALTRVLAKHPTVRGIEQQREIANTDVEIAKQSYKPEWGLTASYGYRQDDPYGNSRADFLSVGVTFDLPIFTESRQDKQVDAARYRALSVETERQLLLRKLSAEFESLTAQINRLERRELQYSQKLLQQTNQQADSALNAYTADRGDFAEVMRAYIAVLNTQIEASQIQVERLKKVVQLNYLLAGEVI